MSHSITYPDAGAWDTFVRQHPRGHLLQLSNWGVLKSHYGWYARRVALADGESILAGGQVLFRRLTFKLGTVAYLPYAPLVEWGNFEQVQMMVAAIERLSRKERAVFLKVEAGFDVPTDSLARLGFRPAPQTVQPPNTIILDLESEETALARMNQMTRRNIRKSEKFEVVVRQGSRADVASFNAMLDETGRRQDFGVHVASYYEHAYELFVPSDDAALFIASYNELDLAGVFVFKVGRWAWYLYGASRDVERQRMATFGVQWAAIQWAMSHGCQFYDLYGIPDADEATLESQFEARHDDLWGVYRFKRGWGGRVARTVGAWEKVYNPLLYWVYQKRQQGD